MPETAQQEAGPTLEEILWRAADRYREPPALSDADEFSAHIARHFDALLPEERFVERFCSGIEKLHQPLPGFVHATHGSLHVYEFDLRRLEYVIVEDEEQVVVVSDFGQFALQRTEAVREAFEAAVLPQRSAPAQPARAWLVRRTGEMVAVEPKKIAQALRRHGVRQVSAPPVKKPARRLAPFHPVRRALGAHRESQVLRDNAPAHRERAVEPAASDEPMVVMLPDGEVARASIGAASRWHEMVGAAARDAPDPGGSSPERFVVRTNSAVAIVTRNASSAGERAELRAQALSAVRTSAAPVRVLGDDELTRAFRRTAVVSTPQAEFWVQPAMPLAETPQVLAAPASFATPSALAAASPDAPVVAFRAPDGTIVPVAAPADVRLIGREQVAPALLPDRRDAAIATQADAVADAPRPGLAPIAPRAGAIPGTSLEAIRFAVERTASAARYKLPFLSTLKNLELGTALPFMPGAATRSDPRILAQPASAGRSAQLLLSMPFPNHSELHVGQDLAQALHAVVANEPAAIVARRPEAPAGATALPATTWIAVHERAVHQADQAAAAPDGVPARGAAARYAEVARTIAALPALLRGAIQKLEGWAPAPGAPTSGAARELAPIPSRELAASAPRPLNAGEEEIVIPLPLWAEMARSRTSELGPPSLDELLVPREHRLVASRAVVFGERTSPVELAGPARIEIVARDGIQVVRPPQRRTLSLEDVPFEEPGPRPSALALDVPAMLPLPLATASSSEPSARDFAASAPAAHIDPGRAAAPAFSVGAPRASQLRSPSEPSWPAPSLLQGVAASAVPTALRFRYPGAPLWWSSSTQDLAAAGSTTTAGPAAAPASSSADIWRSIFLAAPAAALAGVEPGKAISVALDAIAASPARQGRSAPALGAVVRFDRASAVRGPGARPSPDSVEMSIVAAIPPSPPPLESMSTAALSSPEPSYGRAAAQVADAESRATRDAQKAVAEAVSPSGIEGSVEAIAQRIYHRIRRRMQSDRERFGG